MRGITNQHGGESEEIQQPSAKRFDDNFELQSRSNRPRAVAHSITHRRARRSAATGYTTFKLPADDTLRNKYYSEKVEERLGHIKLQRIRRNDQNIISADQLRHPDPGPIPHLPQFPFMKEQKSINSSDEAQLNSHLNRQRAQDLEEIFLILARRNGPMLEQMLSLRDAIDKYFGIFEFMGVANMPPAQRDAAVRRIFDRALEVDVENSIKRERLYS